MNTITEYEWGDILCRERDLIARIMEISPMGVAVMNRGGQIVFANSRAEELLGLIKSEVAQHAYNAHEWHFIDYEGNPVPDEELLFWRVMDTGQSVYDVRLAVEWPDGRRVFLSINAAPLFDTSDRVAGMVATMEEVAGQSELEEALRKCDDLLARVQQIARLGSWEWDIGQNTTTWSDELYRIFGVDPDQFDPNAYEAFLDCVHPADRERVAGVIEKAFADKEPFAVEYRIVRPDGSVRDIYARGEVFFDEADQPVVVSGISQDITERKQAKKALQDSERRFRSLTEATSDWIWEVDQSGIYTYVSPKVKDLLGYNPGEVVGRTPFDFMPPDEAERMGEIFCSIAKSRKPFDGLENTCLHKDGRRVVLETSGVPFFDADGDLLGYRGIDRDITGRKQAESELREAERRFRTLLDSVHMAAVGLDRLGNVAYANPYFLTLTGYTLDQVLGRNWFETFIPERNRPEVGMVFGEILSNGIHPHYKNPILTKGGEERSIFWNNTILLDSSGEPVGTMSIGEDITEREQMLRQLRQQEQLAAVGQLAGGIAHDFNNLLTTITLYAQMPLRRDDLPPDVVRSLETILGESRRAAHLVQQILDFSRRSPMETHPVDLNTCVREVVRVLERTIPENISLTMDVESGVYVVDADPTRIQQVLMNLVVNARDAMPQGGYLQIELSCIEVMPGKRPPTAEMSAGKWICLAVSDTGSGIAPEVLPHIYEPFFTTKPQGKGAGLGLAQAYGIVKQHNGHIVVESEPEQGTTFSVYLPASQTDRVVTPQNRSARVVPRGRGETILLVEDDDQIREAGREILETLGYRVLTASEGQEAKRIYEAVGGIDLLVTDMVMPGLGGRDLIRELRKTTPNLKALVITGYALIEDMKRLEEDVLGIVRKPLDLDSFAGAVRRALDVG